MHPELKLNYKIVSVQNRHKHSCLPYSVHDLEEVHEYLMTCIKRPMPPVDKRFDGCAMCRLIYPLPLEDNLGFGASDELRYVSERENLTSIVLVSRSLKACRGIGLANATSQYRWRHRRHSRYI